MRTFLLAAALASFASTADRPPLIVLTEDAPASLKAWAKEQNRFRDELHAALSGSRTKARDAVEIISTAKIDKKGSSFDRKSARRFEPSTSYATAKDKEEASKFAKENLERVEREIADLMKPETKVQRKLMWPPSKGHLYAPPKPSAKVLEVINGESFLGELPYFKPIREGSSELVEVTRKSVIIWSTVKMKVGDTVDLPSTFEVVNVPSDFDRSPPTIRPIEIRKYIKTH